jgi:uncharacterized protein YjdB
MTQSRRRLHLAVAVLLLSAIFPLGAAAQDVITIGTVTASGSTADVPISIRDVSGTPLGMDRPAGSRIQAFSIKVLYSPASAVQSVSFSRAGITKNLSPVFETSPSSSGATSLLVSFDESTNLVPFTLNGSAPGNVVAHLVFTLAPGAATASSISLTLDSSLTQLTDSGGNSATKETSANGGLTLVNGQINIPALTVGLSPSSKTLSPGGQGSLTATLSRAVVGDTTVTLVSSNPSAATVPASVVIASGTTSEGFTVTGVAAGTSTITATAGTSHASANITVSNAPPQCLTPAAPQLTAPATADINIPYNVTWNAVANATEYVISESATEDFAASASQTVTGTSASFTHATGGVRYYYRVRARNHAATCDLSSTNSTTISVLINDVPVPTTRVLAIVGSLPGNNGSFFRTSLQLNNPHAATITGRLVFHPAGGSGTANDPFLLYSIDPGKTLFFADVLPAMGIAGGFGSLDLVADAASPFPVSLARVFNDGGTAGTSGLVEEALPLERALQAGQTGVLIAPNDVQRFRLNIGLRSLDAGAAMVLTVRDRDGLVVKTVNLGLPPVFFNQGGATGVLDGYVLTGGESITIQMTGGSAFIYGATTDNTTNDPSMQFAGRID